MDRIAELCIALVDTPWTFLLLAVHAFLESSFLPGAHDIFLIAVDVIKPRMSFVFALCSTIGSTCGGCFGYLAGRYWARPLVKKIIHHDIAKTIDASYQKYGIWAVAIAGITPIPYKVFAIGSGFFKIDFVKFAIVSLFARAIRFFTVSTLLFFIGPQIKGYILHSFNFFSIIIIFSLCALVIAYKIVLKRKVNHE